MNKTAKHPKSGNILTFNEEQHKYTTEDIEDFTSVTTLIHSLFEPFDEDGISKRVSKRRNISQEEVLAEWQKKKDVACNLGNEIHLYLEMGMLDNPLPPIVTKKGLIMQSVCDEFIDNFKNHFDVVGTELIVFSEDLKIAGQVDLIARHKKTKTLCVLDYKTSRIINKYNNFNKYAKPPLQHLDDINYTHYSLQLNLYRRLMLLEGYFNEPMKMCVLWIRPGSVEKLPIDNMDKEIDHILNNINSQG